MIKERQSRKGRPWEADFFIRMRRLSRISSAFLSKLLAILLFFMFPVYFSASVHTGRSVRLPALLARLFVLLETEACATVQFALFLGEVIRPRCAGTWLQDVVHLAEEEEMTHFLWMWSNLHTKSSKNYKSYLEHNLIDSSSITLEVQGFVIMVA